MHVLSGLLDGPPDYRARLWSSLLLSVSSCVQLLPVLATHPDTLQLLAEALTHVSASKCAMAAVRIG